MCISVYTTFAHTYCTSSSLYYMYKKHSIYYTVKMFYVKSLVLCVDINCIVCLTNFHRVCLCMSRMIVHSLTPFPLNLYKRKKCELKTVY